MTYTPSVDAHPLSDVSEHGGLLVSIIIPVYNAKTFLQRCLDSVFAQTHAQFEVLAVDDGSNDGSRRVLERNAARDSRLKIIPQENLGQGVARNRALDLASGEFVLFLDADDFLEPVTLELALARACEDESDFVHFDWKLASRLAHRPRAFNYFNIRNLWDRRMLVGSECDELMDTVSFFTVTSLYRTEFLRSNEIRYGEGYIYEDIPFYVRAANRAQRISLLHSPLYAVQPNTGSTTQTARLTDRHATGHVRAIEEALDGLEARSPATLTYFAKYNLQKFIEYSATRVPTIHRARYSEAFVRAFSQVSIELDRQIPVNRYLRFFVSSGLLEQGRHRLFHLIITSRNKTAPAMRRLLRNHKRRNHRVRHRLHSVLRPTTAPAAKLPPATHNFRFDGALLFLGFDSRYSGNSRALFEQLQSDPRFNAHPIYFVTADERVPAEQRITPGDPSLLREALSKASIVFLESWTPPRLPKYRGAIWIQLWHGTPLKRMLFDSHEPNIISRRNDHKVLKHRDIQKWDYLLADSPAAAEKFRTSFLFPSERILTAGYPRVRALLDGRADPGRAASIKEAAGIPLDARVVVYAPTWRDRNYGRTPDELDHSYAIDLDRLAEALGEDYVVVSHDHAYLGGGRDSSHPRAIEASDIDIQDLLIVADGVVSDYSSVVFDCFAAGIPVALYATDLEEYEHERGVYPDIWWEIEHLAVTTPEAAARTLMDAPEPTRAFLDRYAYRPDVDLLDFIDTLDLHHLKRDW